MHKIITSTVLASGLLFASSACAYGPWIGLDFGVMQLGKKIDVSEGIELSKIENSLNGYNAVFVVPADNLILKLNTFKKHDYAARDKYIINKLKAGYDFKTSYIPRTNIGIQANFLYLPDVNFSYKGKKEAEDHLVYAKVDGHGVYNRSELGLLFTANVKTLANISLKPNAGFTLARQRVKIKNDFEVISNTMWYVPNTKKSYIGTNQGPLLSITPTVGMGVNYTLLNTITLSIDYAKDLTSLKKSNYKTSGRGLNNVGNNRWLVGVSANMLPFL